MKEEDANAEKSGDLDLFNPMMRNTICVVIKHGGKIPPHYSDQEPLISVPDGKKKKDLASGR